MDALWAASISIRMDRANACAGRDKSTGNMEGWVANAGSQSVQQLPSSLVGDLDAPLELLGGAPGRTSQQRCGKEPMPERDVAAVQQRAGCDGGLFRTCSTHKDPGPRLDATVAASATSACMRPTAPAQLSEPVCAFEFSGWDESQEGDSTHLGH